MNQQDKERLRELASNVSDRSRATQAGDMEFHRAANPAAILALLEENERLAKDAERYRKLRAGMDNGGEWLRIVGTMQGSGSLSFTGDYADVAVDRLIASSHHKEDA